MKDHSRLTREVASLSHGPVVQGPYQLSATPQPHQLTTQVRSRFFWCIGHKSQLTYVIKIYKLYTVCQWAHFRLNTCRYTPSTPTLTTSHPYHPIPPPTPTTQGSLDPSPSTLLLAPCSANEHTVIFQTEVTFAISDTNVHRPFYHL